MLSVEQVKSRLTLENTIELLEYYGAEIKGENSEYIIFTAICHNSESPKLYLYKSTNTLNCWVEGAVDLISIVEDKEDLNFEEALQFIIDFFQLDYKGRFGRPKRIEHKPREIKKKEITLDEKLPIYQESILNTFIDYQPIEWIKEGISIETMKQFGIKFDINSFSIIIPHYNEDNQLVGIRQRNLKEELIEKYGKYLPYTDPISKIMYNHKLSMCLYGLNINKERIRQRKSAIIFESEKSVLLMNTYYPNGSTCISVGGSVIHDYQLLLLKSLGVEEVTICFDYENNEKLLKKMEKSYMKCVLHFKTFVMDRNLMKQLLEEKDSPIDKGTDIFEELLWNKKEYKLNI